MQRDTSDNSWSVCTRDEELSCEQCSFNGHLGKRQRQKPLVRNITKKKKKK
jgi:hypothetical protein